MTERMRHNTPERGCVSTAAEGLHIRAAPTTVKCRKKNKKKTDGGCVIYCKKKTVSVGFVLGFKTVN